MKRSNVWNVYATASMRYRVVFEEELTEEEAMDAFQFGDFADVIDQEELSIISVGSAE